MGCSLFRVPGLRNMVVPYSQVTMLQEEENYIQFSFVLNVLLCRGSVIILMSMTRYSVLYQPILCSPGVEAKSRIVHYTSYSLLSSVGDPFLYSSYVLLPYYHSEE